MDDTTLAALKGSIAKWEAIVAGTGEDHGCKNCPLCLMFNDADNPDADMGCDGCPVAEKVKAYGCANTPYDEWGVVRGASHKADTPTQKRWAQAELDFLRSLLPNTTANSTPG